MKELTLKEKAKAYDEALKAAKIWKDKSGMPKDKQGILDDIFPELKESEDERIRKALLRFHKSTIDIDGIKGGDILAWLENIPYTIDREKREGFHLGYKAGLEKQGEPTDINPSEFDLRLNKLLKQFETLPKEELASSLSFYLNVVQNDGTYKAEEKQGEQKHVEWHREDEQNLNACLGYIPDEFLRRWLMDVIHVKYDKSADKVEDEEYNGEDYGIDSLYHAQRILEKTLGKVDGYQTDDGILEHKCAISAVKKLYEQKPAEWSEEDERIFGSFLHKLEVCDLLSNKEIRWAKRRLKSLNPQSHWKPTEEQLYMLNWLATNVLDDGVTGKPAKEVLYSLYEQLKQL